MCTPRCCIDTMTGLSFVRDAQTNQETGYMIRSTTRTPTERHSNMLQFGNPNHHHHHTTPEKSPQGKKYRQCVHHQGYAGVQGHNRRVRWCDAKHLDSLGFDENRHCPGNCNLHTGHRETEHRRSTTRVERTPNVHKGMVGLGRTGRGGLMRCGVESFRPRR